MPETYATTAQVNAAIQIIKAVADAIKEATETSVLQGIPSGHLYMALVEAMPALTLNQYHQLTDKLIQLNLVKESNHLLSWIGDAK